MSHPVRTIAVIGACAPERARCAAALAAAADRDLIPAARLTLAHDPTGEAAKLLPWIEEGGAVVEFPLQSPTPELIGTLADGTAEDPAPAHLEGVLAVVDAAHFLRDLQRSDFIEHFSGVHGMLVPTTSARSLLMVEQIEMASAICLVNASQMPAAELQRVRAALSHLAPTSPIMEDDAAILASWARHTAASALSYGTAQTRPGWVCRLNGHHHCRHTCPDVETLTYEQPRPFHPERLGRVLDEEIEPGVHGLVLRSSGFCRLATRPGITGRWSHAGKVITFEPAGVDDPHGEPLSWGQELVLTGVDLDADGLRSALDRAVLTDAELLAGPPLWARLPDPFPEWARLG